MVVVSIGRDTVVLNGRSRLGSLGVPGQGLIAAGLLLAVMCAGLLSPLHFDSAGSRSATETAIALMALVSAVLLWTHFSRTRLLRDLLLLVALGMVSLTDFVFNALPAYAGSQSTTTGVGAQSACAVLAAAAFCAAAFDPARHRVSADRRVVWIAGLATVCTIGIGELIGLIAGPAGTSAAADADIPFVTVAGLISCGGLLAAAFGFVRRGSHEPECGLLACVPLLLAGAWLQRISLPLVPASWVTTADLLRISAVALLLVTALQLYLETREQLTREAISAERLRIARDLHDGLAQDLAFIGVHADRLAREFGAEHPVAVAAGRALAASRAQIVDLQASHATSTTAALRAVAAELQARFGIPITVVSDVADGREPNPVQRTELVRIAREAIANAVCHGASQHVVVTLGSRHGDVLLRVVDDGCGLEAASSGSAGTGLGLSTMRARARALGGRLTVRATLRGGTEVEVVAPQSHPALGSRRGRRAPTTRDIERATSG